MKPTITVAETTAPNGAVFKLFKHDEQFYLYMNDRQVMSTSMTHSEVLLADIGCGFSAPRKSARVLIGGLGLGFTSRRALELLGPEASIITAELLPEIVRWNRECLDGLNDDILADPRTEIIQADVDALIKDGARRGAHYDAIMLDVDDGPSSRLQPQNHRIYSRDGLQRLKAALRPKGRVAFWAAESEPRLFRDLIRAGFRVEETACAKHPRAKRKQHRIYLAARPD